MKINNFTIFRIAKSAIAYLGTVRILHSLLATLRNESENGQQWRREGKFYR